MNRILVICGPTATGKTKLAIKLAKKFNGEIVSADSRQVYQFLDIGIGKDLTANSKFQIPNSKVKIQNYQIGYYLIGQIPVWLYDVVKPDYQFTAADYVICCQKVIENLWQREKLPILVGGTGLYIKALIDGLQTLGVPPDLSLREKLNQKTTEELRNCLQELNPERLTKMNQSDRHNPRRLIRAIEVSQNIKNFGIKNSLKISNFKTCPEYSEGLKIDKLLLIGLKTNYQDLYQLIDRRVQTRVKQGIVQEIQGLLKKDFSWDNSVLKTTIGYRQFQDYFSQKASLQETIQKWQFAEHAYSRRQLTWFRKDPRISWFDILKKDWPIAVEKLINKWYKEKDDAKN